MTLAELSLEYRAHAQALDLRICQLEYLLENTGSADRRCQLQDRIRMLSVILSTWLGAVGILVYQQGFGFVQLYMAPFNMAIPAVAAILIGGASVNKASIGNVVIGTILFQGLVTMTPTVINSLIHIDISEVIRVIVSNGMVVYALTRKTEGGK